MTKRLQGKRARVTGGASGIGLIIAKAFREDGVPVMVGDLSRPGKDLDFAPPDVADWNSVREAVRDCGPIDLLVHCAGIMHLGKLCEADPADYDRVQAVKGRGTFLCCRAAMGGILAAGRGNIIHSASVASLIAVERCAPVRWICR